MRLVLRLLMMALTSVGMRADEPVDWIPVDRSDERVSVELHVEFQADTLPEKQNVVIYFIPATSATREEKTKNRGLAQGGVGPFKGAPAWGYSVAAYSKPKEVLVELNTDSFGSSSTIERAASFPVAYFDETSGERAGISFDIKWKKKPNQPSQPTPPSRRG